MKSYNHLFEKIVNRENINLAIDNASKRKNRRPDVRYVKRHRTEMIEKVRNMLLNDKFKPQIHKMRKIFDGSSRKERYIIQPFFYRNAIGEEVFEQIVQHAVMQVLQPILLKSMYKFSCGSIPKRGGSYGKKYLSKYIRENNNANIKYCCKIDVHHYYESVNIPILKEKLRKIIHDERALKIIFAILDSNKAVYNGEIQEKGLPIGFYTSQWFANFYLTSFDHYVKEELNANFYIRYIDDMVLFGRNKKELHKILKSIKSYLSDLKLELKDNYQVFRFDTGHGKGRPIDFMGYKFYRNRTTLRKRILAGATKKAIKISKKKQITIYDAQQFLSRLGWFKSTKTYKFYNKYINTRLNVKRLQKLVSKKAKGVKNETKIQRSKKSKRADSH